MKLNRIIKWTKGFISWVVYETGGFISIQNIILKIASDILSNQKETKDWNQRFISKFKNQTTLM
jgi:hypothetical protein